MAPSTNRREFLKKAALAVGAAALPDFPPAAAPFGISCNQYSWVTFYAREKKDWGKDPAASLADYASSGLKVYEPSFGDVAEVQKWLPAIRKSGLSVPSVYVNTSLHLAEEAANSITSVLSIAEALKPLNTKIIVTNPNPIRWGGAEDKSDQQLAEQAANLDRLGAALRAKGLKLAYHMHDVELRAAAREFHHMLLATNPQNVHLCLDVHWVYRGSGNSQVALFDIVKLYGKRIAELHIRQSKNGIWQETFGDGDIDYVRLARELKTLNVSPHLVLEQCLEKGSPNTMNAAEAHRIDIKNVAEVFG